jgi:hypothetical protein
MYCSSVIILSVILELPLSVRGVGRRTQPIRKLLNDLLITSALNPTCLLQSALNSVVHQEYLCKLCELFCGHSSSSQECVTVGINLGTVWLLLVVTRRSASGHGVSGLSVVSSGNSCNYCINNVQTLGLRFAIWLSLWSGNLCSRGHGTGCQGVQFNAKWTIHLIPLFFKFIREIKNFKWE